MIAHLGCSISTSTFLANFTATGWTQIATDVADSGSNGHRATAYYKVADSGDTGATDFTFTADAGAESICGAIYRFSGAASAGGAPTGAADEENTATTTPTFVNTMTPAFADCIMLFLASVPSSGGTSFSGYAITTNNPTWTERYDISNTAAGADGDTTLAGATASRPEVTATGDSTVTIANSLGASIGIIVAVYPIVNATVSPAVQVLASSIPAPVISGSANVSAGVQVLASSIPTPTVSVATPDWTNTDKSSTSTFTNPDKS